MESSASLSLNSVHAILSRQLMKLTVVHWKSFLSNLVWVYFSPQYYISFSAVSEHTPVLLNFQMLFFNLIFQMCISLDCFFKPVNVSVCFLMFSGYFVSFDTSSLVVSLANYINMFFTFCPSWAKHLNKQWSLLHSAKQLSKIQLVIIITICFAVFWQVSHPYDSIPIQTNWNRFF